MVILLAGLLVAADAPWIAEGPRPTFTVQGRDIEISGAGNQPNFLRSAAEYENVRVRFEYKLAEWAEAAIVLRAPKAGRPLRAGLPLFLAHDFHKKKSDHVTGAIAGLRPPDQFLPVTFETWHKVVVEVTGDRMKAVIDDTVVQDADIAGYGRLRAGHIVIPDLGHRWRIRDLRVEDLGRPTRFTELFNGRDLAGWTLRGAGEWFVRDGALVGANGHGILYAPPRFRDFELTALVRSRARVNAGIFLRGSPDARRFRGFEVQIYSPPDAVYPTGSIYNLARAGIEDVYEDRWFLMQVRVEGARCVVRLDGMQVAETAQLPEEARGAGHIGLQIHMENAAVEFRDLRVRGLP
jgi:hypothetical protein